MDRMDGVLFHTVRVEAFVELVCPYETSGTGSRSCLVIYSNQGIVTGHYYSIFLHFNGTTLIKNDVYHMW